MALTDAVVRQAKITAKKFIQHLLLVLRRHPTQGHQHVFLLVELGAAQARRQEHRRRGTSLFTRACAVRTFFFIRIRRIRTGWIRCRRIGMAGLLRTIGVAAYLVG